MANLTNIKKGNEARSYLVLGVRQLELNIEWGMVPGSSNWPVLRAASDEMLHLDVLRFVASAGVVVHHSFEFLLPAAMRSERPTGLALFVDLFFVISGFVIAHVYQGKVGTLAGYGSFLQRRVGRLVPLHLLTLFISIAVWAIIVALGKSGNHEPSFDPRCIVETAFFIHTLVLCGNGVSFSSVSWSIGAEMIMYLIFPGFAWLVIRTRVGFIFATVLALITAIVIDSVQNVGLRSWVDLWPAFRALPSFMVGVSVFCLRDKISRIPMPGPLLLFSLVLLIFSMVTEKPHILVIGIVYAVVITAVAADAQRVISKSVRRLAPLGQLTYSIYMWHSLVILIVMNAIGDKLLHAPIGLMCMLGLCSYAITFGVSYFSYFAVETPARRFIDNLGSNPRRTVPATS
jgi:peptidoglycan/LPS O-acetylase OafA/YrhL